MNRYNEDTRGDRQRRRLSQALIVVIISLLVTLTPAATAMAAARGTAANGAAAPATTVTRGLPPLPDWPLIGPILQRLGVVEEEPPAPPQPTADLPEYRIESFEDLDTLEEIEAGERVRLIATDEDLNRMAREVLQQNNVGEADLELDFDINQVTLNVQADETLLEQSGADLPRQVRGDLDVTATVNVIGGNCRIYVEFKKLRVNRWSFGIRPIAERAVNTRIPEIWPDNLCVEKVLLWEGEAAVEGYYRE